MGPHNRFEKIVFLDDTAVARAYISFCVRAAPADRETLIIGMNPLVYSYLKASGYKAQNTLQYCENNSRLEALKKSEEIISWMRQESEFVDLDMGVMVGYRQSFIFFARHLINYYLWAICVVCNAVAAHRPLAVSAGLSDSRHVDSVYLKPEERYLGHITSHVADNRLLKFEDISTARGPNVPGLDRYLSNINAMHRFLRSYVKFKLCNRRVKNSREQIVLTTPLYQMSTLCKALHDIFPEKNVNFLHGPAIPSFDIPSFVLRLFGKKFSTKISEQREMIARLEEKMTRETTLFSYKDIPFGKLAIRKIRDNLANYIIGELLWTIELDRFLTVNKPCAIFSAGNRPDDVILAELSKGRNIKDILISHGSFVPPKNSCEIIEWGEAGKTLLLAPFSHLALQSPLSEGYLKTFSSEGDPVRTGPLIWGRQIDRARARRLFDEMFMGKYAYGKAKVVVHAGTAKPSTALRFHVYESPDEYIQGICDAAEAIEKIPNTVLIIKFRPSTEINIEALKVLVPFSEKVLLSVEAPLADVLALADLVISFSSTVIDEALQNRISILLYGGGGRYQHLIGHEVIKDKPLTESAVYNVKSKNDLEYAIKEIFNIRHADKDVFEPYIYPTESRISLIELLEKEKI